jgi:ABC-type transporter Mla MlaB component
MAVTEPDTDRWMSRRLGFLVRIENDELAVTLDREFLDTCGVGRWAREISRRYPGPYRRIVIDVEQADRAKSTLLAELLHLRDVYRDRLHDGVVLANAGPRLKQLLEIMELREFLALE